MVGVRKHFSTRVKWTGPNIVVKANCPVELMIRGKYAAHLQKNKDLKTAYTKSCYKKPMDTMTLLVDGKDIPVDLVLRVKRVGTPSGQTPIYTMLWGEWLVPA